MIPLIVGILVATAVIIFEITGNFALAVSLVILAIIIEIILIVITN